MSEYNVNLLYIKFYSKTNTVTGLSVNGNAYGHEQVKAFNSP